VWFFKRVDYNTEIIKNGYIDPTGGDEFLKVEKGRAWGYIAHDNPCRDRKNVSVKKAQMQVVTDQVRQPAPGGR